MLVLSGVSLTTTLADGPNNLLSRFTAPAEPSTMLDCSRVTIVVPIYNESHRVPQTLQPLVAAGYCVVAIDDGSTDHSFELMRVAGVTRLRHVLNRGQGAAIQTGIDYALSQGAEYIVTFDADGQHLVSDIPALLQPLVDGRADITLGSRFLGTTINMSRTRWLLLKAGVQFTRLVSGIKVTDTHNGLRAFTAAAARQITLSLDRMEHASEILNKISLSRLRYLEVPCTITYSQETLRKGQSAQDALRVALRFLASLLFK